VSFTYRLYRYSSQKHSTLGLIMAGNKQEVFKCFSLEDEHREQKVAGETRIPAGKYLIKKRHGSPAFGHYDDRWDWHEGMLHLQDVPNFTWIYIHPGNKHEHTEGCILVGDGVQSNVIEDGMVTNSRQAYEKLYKEIDFLLAEGRNVFLEVIDYA